MFSTVISCLAYKTPNTDILFHVLKKLYVCIFSYSITDDAPVTDRLARDLFRNYEKKARPTTNISLPTEVFVTFLLNNIEGIVSTLPVCHLFRRLLFEFGALNPVSQVWVGPFYLPYKWLHLFNPSLSKKHARNFIHSFVCLFVCSFVHSFVHSFIRLFICSFICLFIHSFIYLFLFKLSKICKSNIFSLVLDRF